jgi:hypothetical protein
VIDLDPKEAPFSDVIRCAQVLHRLCEQIGLQHYVKTTGKTGLHIMVPLARRCTYEQSRTLGELLAPVLYGIGAFQTMKGNVQAGHAAFEKLMVVAKTEAARLDPDNVDELVRVYRAHNDPSYSELGCFDGKVLDFLPSRPDYYVGYDANWEGGLDLARQRWGSFPNYHFRVCTTPAEMDFGSERFDVAIVVRWFRRRRRCRWRPGRAACPWRASRSSRATGGWSRSGRARGGRS